MGEVSSIYGVVLFTCFAHGTRVSSPCKQKADYCSLRMELIIICYRPPLPAALDRTMKSVLKLRVKGGASSHLISPHPIELTGVVSKTQHMHMLMFYIVRDVQ